jgi:hypothetical protein
MMNRDTGIVYRLNGRDELVYVNDEWVDFAVANDAPDLLSEQVVGRPFWDFIGDQTTVYLYREILLQVRAGRPASFTFRCDAPERRRLMGMTIAVRDGGEVQFETRTLREDERPRQELLDRYATRAGGMLRMCSWCKRVDIDGARWGEIEEAVTALRLFERETLPPLTHGMCEACFKTMNEKIAEHRERSGRG